MAAKEHSNKESSKRKRIGGSSQKEGEKSISKKPKFVKSKSTKPSTDGLKKSFNKSTKPYPVKAQYEKSDYVEEKKEPKTKREARLQAKVDFFFLLIIFSVYCLFHLMYLELASEETKEIELILHVFITNIEICFSFVVSRTVFFYGRSDSFV